MLGIPFFLLPMRMQHAIREQERRKELAIKVALEAAPVQKWTPDLKWAPFLRIDGESYEYKPLFDLPVCKLTENDPAKWARSDDWGYRNVLCPQGEYMRTAVGSKGGHVCFTTDVVIPALWMHHPKNVWMSITPFEQLSQRPGIKKARGRVLVGGLGMGWALRELALRKSVKHLIVVENSIPLLDWFGRDLVKKIGEETGREIEIVVDDAYKAADRLFGETDSFIFDIWKAYGAARSDYRWQIVAERAREAKKVAWGWGASGAPRRGEDDDDWGY